MSQKSEHATDAKRVLTLLKKKKRTWASDLGSTVAFMKFLESHGLVKADGPIKTGKPGKPPVAWKFISDDLSVLPDFETPAVTAKKAISQTTIDRVIADVGSGHMGSSCHCVIKMGAGTTAETIRELGIGRPGCNDDGRYVCPALDAVRRRADLFAPPEPFQEVV